MSLRINTERITISEIFFLFVQFRSQSSLHQKEVIQSQIMFGINRIFVIISFLSVQFTFAKHKTNDSNEPQLIFANVVSLLSL